MARTAIRSRSPQSSPFSYNMAKTDQHSGPYRLQNEPEEDHIAQIFNCLQSSSTAAFQTIGSLDTKGNYEDDDSIEIHNVYLHHAQSKASTVVPNAPNSCHGPEDAPSNVRRHSNNASAAKYPTPAAAVTKHSHGLIRHEDPRSNPDCTLRRSANAAAPVVATRPSAINLDNPATGAGGESGDDRRLGRRFARGHFSSALASEAACDERRQPAPGGDGAEAVPIIKVMRC